MSDLALTQGGGLRAGGGDKVAHLHKAAAQFEATFLQQILKPLDEHTIDDEPIIGGDSATSQFKSLYHSALSEQSAGGLGIADLVFKELSARAGLSTTPNAHKKEVKP